ncbi:MAG TPA: zinc ribbon domain-containing protein [Thermoanaerobaculia bacterium]|nr:zinc ribbon domain-containing protein [Thermoanaerobaculia bacterium]
MGVDTMPIYEFYCPSCDTLFNFFSSSVDTATRPPCPRCGGERLERKPARFATITRSGGGEEGGGEEDFAGLGVDEERLGAAFEAALAEAEAGGDEDDPRQVARIFRRVGETAGLEPGPAMQEMLRRLEAGDDPDRLEEEMGGALAGDEEDGELGDPLAELFRRKRSAARRRAPKRDEELYFL